MTTSGVRYGRVGITLFVIGALVLGFGLFGHVAGLIAEYDARLVVLSSLVLIGVGFLGLVMMVSLDTQLQQY